MTAEPIVGIDLGTTNSAIGVLEGDKVRLFPNPLDELLTPSAVAVDPKTNSLVVGRTARDLIAVRPTHGALRFKLDMGTDRTFTLGERKLTAIELSAHVLDALRGDAERALGRTVSRCVITVPAYFDDAQRHATREAGALAGLVVERIVNEPTAAAIAYGLHKRNEETLFAVVDLGGGTFDVCVMELFDGVLQVKGVAGESRLGGEDFTEMLADHMADRAGLTPPLRDSRTWALLFRRAELAKRSLARWPETDAMVSAEITGGQPRELRLIATEVEALWRPLIDRLLPPLRGALRGAGIKSDQLAEVVLVGGATRMPCVGRAVQQVLGHEPRHHADPDLLVAEGAAIQAAMLGESSAVGDMVVTDVASHSLGVDTSRKIGNRQVDGYFQPIIHRNTVIPTSRREVFSTINDDQREVVFGVYEGEARRVADNRKIGELTVKGIPRGPAPKAVEVRFTYDQNGMLEVEAEVCETKKRYAQVFHRSGKTITGAELEQARTRLRSLRADPMDRPRFRDVHARAKALWQEAEPVEREVLGVLIDELDAAIEGRNPQEIERAYNALLRRCAHLEQGERR
jgi:molecular chaperone HscC